jgi:hypothetical protein
LLQTPKQQAQHLKPLVNSNGAQQPLAHAPLPISSSTKQDNLATSSTQKAEKLLAKSVAQGERPRVGRTT